MDVCKGERRLFDEMQMGSLVARNRFVRAATYEGAADAAGRITPEIMRIYRELARGGVGTIITSFAYVRDDGYHPAHMMGLDRDELVPAWRELVACVHEAGAAIVAHRSPIAAPAPVRGRLQLLRWAPRMALLPMARARCAL